MPVVMRVQQQRSDVLPLTWEPPTAIGLAWLVGATLALPAGQGIAFALSGRPFMWPTGRVLESVLGLAQGRLAVGLTDPGGQLPSGTLVLVCCAVLELALALACAWVVSLWWSLAGPGVQSGLASRHEMRAVLGPAQLRTRRKTIRPDLQPRTLREHLTRGEP